MEANVIEYTTREGGRWLPWPFRSHIKPTNPDLLTKPSNYRAEFVMRGHRIVVHALRLDNGVVWDSINGFRNNEGP